MKAVNMFLIVLFFGVSSLVRLDFGTAVLTFPAG